MSDSTQGPVAIADRTFLQLQQIGRLRPNHFSSCRSEGREQKFLSSPLLRGGRDTGRESQRVCRVCMQRMETEREVMQEASPPKKNLPLQHRFRSFESTFKSLLQGQAFNAWVRKQSAPVEIAATTAVSALQGALLGGLMGTLTADVQSSLPNQAPGMSPQTMAPFQQAQALTGGPLIQARNFAVMTGVNSGISCAMRRMRGGVEDTQTSMVAAFGSGAVFSLVSGVGGPNLAVNAVTTGIFFALIQGGMHKLGTLAQPPPDDKYYIQTKSMLGSLGLERYEKNFKKGLLTDSTLHLLNDSALREVKIPPGPRLLILDHVRS